MQKLFLAALALGAAFALQAQNTNTIATDNLGQVMSSRTVGNNTLQAEAGYSYFQRDIKPGDFDQLLKYRSNIGRLKLRYGFLNLFEIAAQYTGENYNGVLFNKFSGYSSNYLFQVKANILRGNGLSPSIAAGISYERFEFSDEYKASIAAGSELTKKLSARVLLEYILDNGFDLGVHLNYKVTDKFLVFTEYVQETIYSRFSEESSHLSYFNVNMGAGYNFSKNTQVSIFGTYYLPNEMERNFNSFSKYSIHVNFATRLNWDKDIS